MFFKLSKMQNILIRILGLSILSTTTYAAQPIKTWKSISQTEAKEIPIYRITKVYDLYKDEKSVEIKLAYYSRKGNSTDLVPDTAYVNYFEPKEDYTKVSSISIGDFYSIDSVKKISKYKFEIKGFIVEDFKDVEKTIILNIEQLLKDAKALKTDPENYDDTYFISSISTTDKE